VQISAGFDLWPMREFIRNSVNKPGLQEVTRFQILTFSRFGQYDAISLSSGVVFAMSLLALLPALTTLRIMPTEYISSRVQSDVETTLYILTQTAEILPRVTTVEIMRSEFFSFTETGKAKINAHAKNLNIHVEYITTEYSDDW
jgi:hypothetical protein